MKVHDVVDGLHADGVLPGELVLRRARRVTTPDLAYVNPGERCQPVVLSPIALVVTNAVFAYVLSSRTPFEVGQRSIEFASRAVKCFFSLRAQADEGFQDEMMHEPFHVPFTTGAKLNFGISIVLPDVVTDSVATTHTPPCLPGQRTHATEVADFVEAFPAEYRLPEFAHPGMVPQRGEY